MLRRISSLLRWLAATLLRILASVRQSKVGRTVASWTKSMHGALPTRKAVGQGLVEYGLILMLIAIVAIGAITILGRKSSQMFSQISCEFSNGEHGQGGALGNCTPQ